MKKWASLIASFVLGVLLTSLFFIKRGPSSVPTAPAVVPQCSAPPPSSSSDCGIKSNEPVAFSHDILPPPKFRKDSPPAFVTNREGEVHVTWMSVKGAKSYRIFLVSQTGAVVKAYTSSKTSLYLKDLPLPPNAEEATYDIQLASLNADDTEGAKGERRELKVARQADVMAPTVKNIVIED